MGWARFDDGYMDHPKVIAAGPMGELMDARAIIYCAKHETDGHISTAVLYLLGRGIPNPKKHVAKLLEVGLWDETERGWLVHNYLDYNPSKAQLELERGANRTRQEIYRTRGLAEQIKQRDGDRCRYCDREVNWKDRRGTAGAVFEHVVPVVANGETTLANLVVACRGCNLKKGGRTPEEAEMKLLPRADLGLEPRSVGSGRESLVRPKMISRCKRCDRLTLDCDCPPLELVEDA